MDTLIHRVPKTQSNPINLARLHAVIVIIVIPVIIIIGAITEVEHEQIYISSD